MGRRHLVGALLRYGRLAAVSYAVGMITWTLLGPAPLAGFAVQRPGADPNGAATALTVSVDGLVASASGSGTVADALRVLGVRATPADRLSSPAQADLRPGQRIALDRGLPVTVFDAGQLVLTRSAPGTVAELLSAAGLKLGSLDRIDRPLDAHLYPGDVVRITRIAEGEVTVQEDVPFGVRYVADPNLDLGRHHVQSAGIPGKVANTYLVRTVDGREESRQLVRSVQVSSPVAEIRRAGTRSPFGREEIVTIIRDAAARHGADADQLLRVAWCESRYDPNAYNASGASGLFQFMPRTWAANSARVGLTGASPFDPVASANVAAWMFARGSSNLWSCR